MKMGMGMGWGRRWAAVGGDARDATGGREVTVSPSPLESCIRRALPVRRSLRSLTQRPRWQDGLESVPWVEEPLPRASGGAVEMGMGITRCLPEPHIPINHEPASQAWLTTDTQSGLSETPRPSLLAPLAAACEVRRRRCGRGGGARVHRTRGGE